MPFEWSIYRWLPGRVATPGRLRSPKTTAETLGGFVTAIRAIDPTGGPLPGPHNGHRGVPLADRDTGTRAAIDRLGGEIDVDAAAEAWEHALAAPVWEDPGVWIHGDLWETNLLLDERGDLGAVIDFGCLGVGDPATDLTVAWNLFDAPTRDVFRGHCDVDDATWDRGRGWALSFAVIALPYYLDTNPVIVANARRMIDAVLED
jgi:aminoglycoside phosphotransferase (APT) family kinase protein